MKPHDLQKEAAVIRRLAGKKRRTKGELVAVPTTDESRTLARDVLALVAATVRDIGGDVSATTRVLVATFARRSAVAAFYDQRAVDAGLATDEGRAFAHLASVHQAAARQGLKVALVVHDVLTARQLKPNDALESLRTRIANRDPE